MNQRLEQYLSDAEQKLQSLPPARRQEEIGEIREHLVASIEAREEIGQTTDIATEDALAQFGAVQQVTVGLQRVWWREQIGGPQGLWKSAALALALTYTISNLLSPLGLIGTVPRPAAENWIALDLLVLFLTMVLPSALTGIVLAKLTPRNAVLGTVFGTGLHVAHNALTHVAEGLIPHTHFQWSFEYSTSGALLNMLVTVGAAWLTVHLARLRPALAQ